MTIDTEKLREKLKRAFQILDLAGAEGLHYRAAGEVWDAGDALMALASELAVEVETTLAGGMADALIAMLPVQGEVVAYQRFVDGKWQECSEFVAKGWGELADGCRALYAMPQAAPAILTALDERAALTARVEALEGALSKAGFLMTEPAPTPSFPRARQLVIGFENPDHADEAMQAISNAVRSARQALENSSHDG